MEDLESKMASILGDPQMMQKIQAMAQSLGAQATDTPQAAPPADSQAVSQTVSQDTAGGFPDLGTLQKISGLMGKSQIDGNQRSLLRALSPYVNPQRIQKLERAMRAAKMAGMASALLKSGR